MSIRDRTLVMVTFLLIFTILVISGVLSWASRKSLLEQATLDAKVIAQLFSSRVENTRAIPSADDETTGASLARLADRLVGSGNVLAIHAVDSEMNILASSVLPGAPVSQELSQDDLPFLQSAIEQNQAQVQLSLASAAPSDSLLEVAVERIRTIGYLDDSVLKVAVPINDLSGGVMGAAILYLPMDRIESALIYQWQLALVIAAFALIYGIEASIVWSRRVTRPLARMKEAAIALEKGNFDPEMLKGLVKRKDETGKLATVFNQMAQQVKAREQRLKDQVEALRIEIDTAKTKRQVEEITDTEYFRQLQARVKELRSRGGKSKL
ncbi:MAG: HAMP domain-containing protein [Anaerolineales bacterium]|nr:HAMP domain-containing protein [Anaerolineales bacterium]